MTNLEQPKENNEWKEAEALGDEERVLRNKIQAVLINRYLGFKPENRSRKEFEWVEKEARSFSDLFDEVRKSRPDLIKRLTRLGTLKITELKAKNFTPDEDAALEEISDALYNHRSLAEK